MKKHLFYTFLAIFATTALVTLLGVTGVLRIADGYLSALVTAFLVELAAAVVAMFRTAEFFKDDEQRHLEAIARVTQGHAEAVERLRDAASRITGLQDEISRLEKENQHLTDSLKRVDSFRLRVLAILGSASADRSMILRELQLKADSPEGAEALSVIGQMVRDEEIEPDPRVPSGYYRFRRRAKDA